MKIWPLLFLIAAGLILAALAESISGGLPWGVDDGVKRLMARQWIQSGGRSMLFLPHDTSPQDARFFALPSPFVEPTKNGFAPVFPALFPAAGGALWMLCGETGIYLLPALSYLLLIYFFVKMLRGFAGKLISLWAALMLASPLLFYGLTFWEHAPALLCLLPLMHWLSSGRPKGGTAGLWAGSGLGVAVYLRLEIALLAPILLLVLLRKKPLHKNIGTYLRESSCALWLAFAASLLASSLFEYFAAGRLIPPQARVNLSLALSHFDGLQRMEQTFAMLLNSPLLAWVYALILIIILVFSILKKAPLVFAMALPILSLALLAWGWLDRGAFGMVAGSQGLFFALPWIGILLANRRMVKKPTDGLLVLGAGYLVLLYLLAPHQPGMHWGPRFLFPAVLPLLICSARALQSLSSAGARRSLMMLTALAALVNGSVSVAALAQRGASGAEVISSIRAQECDWLVVNRWHAGADLQPLWDELEVAWTVDRGDLEEWMIQRAAYGDSLRLGFLWQDADFDAASLPLQIEGRIQFPRRAGWGGDLWVASLAEGADAHWGEIYWRAARRRAEVNALGEALTYFNKATLILRDNPDLFYDTAVCLGRMGRSEEAISVLQRVLTLNPRHPEALKLWRGLSPSR